jgi:plasmid stability protein
MEEEHRRILREALRGNRKAASFKAHLLAIPAGEDVLIRKRTTSRRQTGL